MVQKQSIMAIPTTRTKENGVIHVDPALCTGCGLCVEVCSDNSLVLLSEKAGPSDDALFGCIACGHCMAVCPEDAIRITGRAMPEQPLFELPSAAEKASYESLQVLLQRRRSIRKFKPQAVEAEKVQKILEAASTAPMGLPPSDVHVLVLNGKEQNQAFAKDYVEFLKGYKWFVSSWFLGLMRPFWGKSNDEMFRGFIRPLFKTYVGGMEKGQNNVTYDAPLAMYFYGSPYSDPADPIVAATFAMLAAESLGLGTCMLGAIHPMIQYGKKGKRFREKHGIKYPSREGLFVIFGYPAFKFRKGIRRTFAGVTHV